MEEKTTLKVGDNVYWRAGGLCGHIIHMSGDGTALVDFHGFTGGHGSRAEKWKTSCLFVEKDELIKYDELMTALEAHNRAVTAEFCGAAEEAKRLRRVEKELIEKREYINRMESLLVEAVEGLEYLKMDNYGEYVFAVYKNGHTKEISIGLDSKIAILKDVVNGLCY